MGKWVLRGDHVELMNPLEVSRGSSHALGDVIEGGVTSFPITETRKGIVMTIGVPEAGMAHYFRIDGEK